MRISTLPIALLSVLPLIEAHERRTFTQFAGKFSTQYFSAQSEVQQSLRKRQIPAGNAVTAALNHLSQIAPDTEYRATDDYYTDEDTGVLHIYFVQTHNGLDIDNARANVNIKKDKTVLSSGSSFLLGKIQAPPLVRRAQLLSPVAALKGAIKTLGLPINAEKAREGPKRDAGEIQITSVTGTVSDPKANLVYYRVGDELKLSWRLETDIDENWLLVYADASEEGIIHAVTDYVADAGYNVYPLGINDPLEGDRVFIEDPALLSASPDGFHKAGQNSYTSTQGNNGIAQENFDGSTTVDFFENYRPSSTNLDFDYPYDLNATDPKSYIDASITQLFYTSNVFHDLLEALGFTEAAGNFEEVNTGPGGRGGDAVQLNAQDGRGKNNANFATPTDGNRPRMRMYMWDKTSPERDGSFDAGIVIHEYTHGLSNRLTGGPANSGCLFGTEAGGMGEGWSDIFATAVRIKAGDTRDKDYLMSDWATGGAGIRLFPYSTSLERNPLNYTTLNEPIWQSTPHRMGTIWANMLYEVLWNFIEKYGYSENRFPEYDEGKILPNKGVPAFLKVLIEAMKLQPCQPTFIQARDAIVDADLLLTEGENYCEIWRPFAKRGLGVNAKQGTGSSGRTAGYELPEGC